MFFYGGWANPESLNVATWIVSHPALYRVARGCYNYGDFVAHMAENQPHKIGYRTPDGVYWNDCRLQRELLDDLISSLN